MDTIKQIIRPCSKLPIVFFVKVGLALSLAFSRFFFASLCRSASDFIKGLLANGMLSLFTRTTSYRGFSPFMMSFLSSVAVHKL